MHKGCMQRVVVDIVQSFFSKLVMKLCISICLSPSIAKFVNKNGSASDYSAIYV